MLTVLVILFLLWACGFGFHVAGNAVHLLLLVILVIVVINLLERRSTGL